VRMLTDVLTCEALPSRLRERQRKARTCFTRSCRAPGTDPDPIGAIHEPVMSCEQSSADALTVCNAACRRFAVTSRAHPTERHGVAALAGLPGAAPRAAVPVGCRAGRPPGSRGSAAAVRRRDVQHVAVAASTAAAPASAAPATVLYGRCDWSRHPDVVLDHSSEEVESVAAFAAVGNLLVSCILASESKQWLATGSVNVGASFACDAAMGQSAQRDLSGMGRITILQQLMQSEVNPSAGKASALSCGEFAASSGTSTDALSTCFSRFLAALV